MIASREFAPDGRAGERAAPRRVAGWSCRTALCVLAVVMCACAKSDPDRVPRANLVTGSTGGGWYLIGSAIAERTNQSFPGRPLTAMPGAGGVSNPARIAKLPGDLGISYVPFLRAAYRGDPPYPERYAELRHVATLIDSKFHLLIADTLEMTSLGDIRSRRLPVRIATGPPGSAEEFMVRESLKSYGISYDDIRNWGGRIDLLGTSERADAWRDHHVNLVGFMLNEPAAIVMELIAARPARIWSVPATVSRDLEEKWGVRSMTIPGRSYPNHPEPTVTLGMATVLFTTSHLGDDVVYALTKMIAESQPYLVQVHAAFNQWRPAEMAAHGDVPVHSGSARYYRERGWTTP